jgi:putative oxygen-independent coproporphyrinogen III oxidase
MAADLLLADPAPANGLFSTEELIGSKGRSFHAYVHIPFCRDRCGYCDFNTYTASEIGTLKQSDFANTLIAEIEFSSKVLETSQVPKRSFKSIFFGGGTPTVLPAADLIAILSSLESEFGFEDGVEISFEANPDTVTLEMLTLLKEAGFNRISIGMQSAVPEVLAILERTHNPENVSLAIDLAKSVGLRTSLDLIFGAPGESLAQWKQSIEAVLTLNPDHISAYGLIVEKGTKLARQIKTGKLPELDEDLQADKYELADKLFSEAGYVWYEISNWSKTVADRSTHNLCYWQGQDWWGYGPGAHSHLGSTRWWNVKHPLTYSQKLEDLVSPAAGREMLDEQTRIFERLLLEVRIADGMQISELKAMKVDAVRIVSELIADGLIDGKWAVDGKLVLTLKGRLMADAVVRRLTD